jgi:hypothetical protein
MGRRNERGLQRRAIAERAEPARELLEHLPLRAEPGRGGDPRRRRRRRAIGIPGDGAISTLQRIGAQLDAVDAE